MSRIGKVLATAGALSVFIASCTGPGQGIADRIRAANSPLVREVFLSPANPWEGSGDAVYVYLKDEATDAQALDLWCNVVIPAGADELPPGRVQVLKGFELLPGGGRSGGSQVLHDPTCPGDASPAPAG